MLISRAIRIENEDVNLKKGTTEAAHTKSACLRASLGVSGHCKTVQTPNEKITN